MSFKLGTLLVERAGDRPLMLGNAGWVLVTSGGDRYGRQRFIMLNGTGGITDAMCYSVNIALNYWNVVETNK